MPDAGVLGWLESRSEASLYLSVVTIGEIVQGLHKLGDEARRRRIHDWLDEELRPRFSGRLLAIDERVAETWGTIRGRAAKQGSTLPVMDAWIAATAITHQLEVVTRNEGDLVRCGCRVFNPWGA